MEDKNANLHVLDSGTLVLIHLDENGEEVSVEFDVDDDMSPLTFKTYLENNKIETCNFWVDDDGDDERYDVIQRFFENAEKLFTIGDYYINSGQIN